MGCYNSKINSLRLPTDAEMNEIYLKRKKNHTKALERKNNHKAFLVKTKKKRSFSERRKLSQSKLGEDLIPLEDMVKEPNIKSRNASKRDNKFKIKNQDMNPKKPKNQNKSRKKQSDSLSLIKNHSGSGSDKTKLSQTFSNLKNQYQILREKRRKNHKIHQFSSDRKFVLHSNEKSNRRRKRSSNSEQINIRPFFKKRKQKKKSPISFTRQRQNFLNISKNYEPVKKSVFRKAKEDEEFKKELSQINLLADLDSDIESPLDCSAKVNQEHASERVMILPREFTESLQKSLTHF